jgi:hypothetical protein
MMMDFFEPGELLFIAVLVIIALFEYECWPMNILKDWTQRRLHAVRRNIIVLRSSYLRMRTTPLRRSHLAEDVVKKSQQMRISKHALGARL